MYIDYLHNFFFFGSSIFFVFITQQVYKKKIINNDKKKTLSLYENKYKERFNKLANCKLEKENLSNLKNNIVIENTPKGNVILFYDHDYLSFFYYCDNKDISYYYLETVSRKYVIQFNCKSIYLIQNDENKEKKEKKVNKVFANLKSKKNDLIDQEGNKYRYCGKINFFSFFKKKENKKQISFKDFKNLNKT